MPAATLAARPVQPRPLAEAGGQDTSSDVWEPSCQSVDLTRSSIFLNIYGGTRTVADPAGRTDG